jgi:hypothetical protein
MNLNLSGRVRQSAGVRAKASRIVASAAAVVLGLMGGRIAAGTTDPELVFDLRVRATGGKEAIVSSLGEIVDLDIYVRVLDADGDSSNDGLWSGIGAIRSSTGGLLGDLRGLSTNAPFNALGSSPGIPTDLDGDGDKDVGNADHADATGFFAFRSPSLTFDQPDGGFFVGRARFSATSLAAESTQVNWSMRVIPPNPNQPNPAVALFQRDGVFTLLNGDSPLLGVGAPVTIRASQIIPPGATTYLGGTVNTHLVVENGTVRAANNLPPLILAGGATVKATGVLDTRDDNGNYNGHQLIVNDAVSRNEGGAIFINSIKVGDTSTGARFTQSGGFTQLGSTLTLGGQATGAGTLLVTGGNMQTPAAIVGEAGAGTILATGGHLTIGTLTMSKSFFAHGRIEVSADGDVAVTNESKIVSPRALLRVSGGRASFGSPLSLESGARIEVTGGTLDLNIVRLYEASITQTGGLVNLGGMKLGASQFDFPPVAPSDRYTLAGGTLAGGGISLFWADPSSGLHQSGGYLQLESVLTSFDRDRGPSGSYRLSGGTAIMTRLHVGPTPIPTVVQTGGSLRTDIAAVGAEHFPGGTWQIAGGSVTIVKQLGNTGTVDFANGSATLIAGARSFIDFARLPGAAVVNSSNASLVGGVDSLLNFPAGFDPFASFASIETQGLIHVNGQPLTIPQGRTVAGSGSIDGDVTNHGKISPGHSAGQIVLLDDYAQDPNAILEIEIGGRASDKFDLLSVAGGASLDGTLGVSLIDDFIPLASDSFTFLTADGGVLGRFANTLGDQVYFDGGRFDVSYSGNAVTLSNFAAVPEPAGAALAFAGVIASATTLRRRARSRRC